MSTTLHSPPQTIAPWAEVVPGFGPVTVDFMLTIPDDGYIYEVVEGVLVRVAGSGEEASTIGLELGAVLRNHVRPRRLGRVTGAAGIYKFSGAETGLVPDVGFYRAELRALAPDHRKPIPFAPDLAVEVASPDQRPDELAAKVQFYLRGGTRLIWVIWPSTKHIDVWRKGQPFGPQTTRNVSENLDGEDVVPGFSYPVAAIFADPLDDDSVENGEPVVALS